ncbi:MAG: hydrogenase maturation protease [Candidatus Methanomethylophilaceae archaeon]|jgi:hydrogenase maturation protease|nr:hydrogenase maturation protease [Candidatus Methanomethylophilaceae archaeon]
MSDERSDNILVIGLGSPIMSDDAIGLVVSEKIESMNLDKVETRQEAIGGLDIIPVLWGYKHAIIVDAIQTEQYEPGTVMIFDPEDFAPTITNASAHDFNLATAMKIGRDMEPEQMPDQVIFVAIEVEDIQTMHEGMTPKVDAAVGKAVDAVLHYINDFQKSN